MQFLAFALYNIFFFIEIILFGIYKFCLNNKTDKKIELCIDN